MIIWFPDLAQTVLKQNMEFQKLDLLTWVSQEVLFSVTGKVHMQRHSTDIGCLVREDKTLCQVSHKQLFSITG